MLAGVNSTETNRVMAKTLIVDPPIGVICEISV
jgi:hypothetical protein